MSQTTNAIELTLLQGDLSKLNPNEKLSYFKSVCESVGLNPLTKPFEYIKLNGKEVLYATKGCAEQLRAVHKVSLRVTNTQKIDDVYIVTVEATDANGRTDSSTGVVTINGLKGDALANALMKAETKAKRRVTLSICGLNMLDELEVETIRPSGTGGEANLNSLRESSSQKVYIPPSSGAYITDKHLNGLTGHASIHQMNQIKSEGVGMAISMTQNESKDGQPSESKSLLDKVMNARPSVQPPPERLQVDDNEPVDTITRVFELEPEYENNNDVHLKPQRDVYTHDAGEYVMPFGNDKGKKLKDIPEYSLKGTLAWCDKNNKTNVSSKIREYFAADEKLPF